MSDDNATNEALAAIGSSVANVDTYESSVLRQATLKSAPTLSGVGFPDLSSLAPSFDTRTNKLVGSADTPHVHTLLQRTRAALARSEPESHRSLILLIKEQMLLTYLQKVSRLPPEPEKYQFVSRITRKEPKLWKDDGRLARPVTSASTMASFGRQALLERKECVKRRTSMTQQKQNRHNPINEEDEEVKEMLRQRRNERLERRRKRAEQWAKSKEEEEEAEEDVELTFEGDSAVRSQDTGTNGKSGQEAADPLTCPICEEALNAGSTQEESDAILSRHIETCQQGGLRTRRRRTHVSTEQGGMATIQTARKEKQSSRKLRQSQLPSVRSALDDFQEWDYEDRIDNWIISGIGRMRHMEERDETETPPGTVTYDGGLVVPGWVNNRLFPYQRTGLRWMWELHIQEAGGVIGDGKSDAKDSFHFAFLLNLTSSYPFRDGVGKNGSSICVSRGNGRLAET